MPSVIGKVIVQPLTGRRLRIVADEHADPELGSGAVKITPGHDFNDFEVGKRAGIKPADMLNMFDAEAKVVQTSDGLIPDKYLGLDRFVVRDMIVADMKAAGFLVPHVTKDKDGEEVVADAEPRTIADPVRGSRRGGDRTVADRSVVRQRGGTGEGAAGRGALGRGGDRAEVLGEDVLQLDGEYPAVVCQPPAVVGAPDSGLVWAAS